MKRRIDLANESEAVRFTAILDDEGIPNTVVSNHSTPYDGIFQLQNGWGFAEVPEEYGEKAERLLEEYRESI